ncbi:MAG TPA: hypothetical protein VN849_04530, partial [Stellaceae bacterium]|nr:hypothetical protein [Stellaceae bacterium]
CAGFGGPCRVRKRTGYTPQQRRILPPHLHLEADEALSFAALAVNGNRRVAGASHDWAQDYFRKILPESPSKASFHRTDSLDDAYEIITKGLIENALGSPGPIL